MTAHRSHQGKSACRTLDLFAQYHRREKLTQSGPRSICPFVAIKRTLACRTLAPTLSTVGISHAGQNNTSLSSTTEACFEEVDERQADFAQFDRLDKQCKKVFLRDRHYAFLYLVLTTREISAGGISAT